ncbi:MAG: TIGR04141 family sporadically distributed protein [Polyangiaceae bacterium]|nr:TIGR04141 family sporadically distributed protein [Polyangiaceae bacterium]
MPGFNFFRVFKQQKQHLTTHLTSKGMALIEQKDVVEGKATFRYELYFTEKPPKKTVKWLKELQRQFSIKDFKTENYSAVVLISFLDHVYAITFGPSHFLVSKFSDLEFGINIASRVLKRYKTKNSREFGGVKVKSIETYLSTEELPFEAGEAVNYIKGVPINAPNWGNNVSCGQSVQLRKRTLSLKNIHQMCAQLEAALSLPVRREIPKAAPVKDPVKRQALTQKLISDMQNDRYMVSISQQQLSGVAFLFADQHDFVCLVNGKPLVVIDEHLSLKKLRTVVQKHFGGDYQKLLDATVLAQEDGNTVYSKPFIKFIDYIDTQDNHYLEDGEWHQFDKNYLSNVRNEVDRIPLAHSTEMLTFDEQAYSTWLATQKEKHYRERYLNNLLEAKHKYVNHDRTLDIFEGASTEITDLLKGDTIYIVKIGIPQKLNYAIDQALSAVKVLERQSFQVPVKGTAHTVQRLCLWLFLDRQTHIKRISEINSLIFLMKLAHWRKSVLLSGLQPEIRISYKT